MATIPTQRSKLRFEAFEVAAGVFALLAVLVGVNAGGWRTRLFGNAAASPITSLAVLPLVNLSQDAAQEYFANGMTEALIANLAQVKALRVISRTSVMHYKNTNLTLPEIAGELNVDAVIEGAVQRSGSRVQVTVKLIRVQSDAPVWAKVYERNTSDLLAMQSDLTQAIVGEIKVHLTPEERQHIAVTRPVNSKAYDAYLLGNYHANLRNPAAMEKAIEYFHRAIWIDPNYAQAYAGLANVYIERGVWAGVGIGREADLVRTNTLKALELDGDLAEAHELLGSIHFQYDWDWERAEAEFKRAIALNPNLPGAYARYAFYLQTMGRQEEALAAVHHAVELDPLSASYICDEGRILYRARQYQKAIAQYQRALELDPGYAPVPWRMSDAYEQVGEYDQALAWADRYQQASGDPRLSLRLQARILGRTGKRREAEEKLRTIEKRSKPGGDEQFLAATYCVLGHPDQAIAQLEKGAQTHSILPFAFVDPQFDSLRSDPRFQQLLRRVHILF